MKKQEVIILSMWSKDLLAQTDSNEQYFPHLETMKRLFESSTYFDFQPRKGHVMMGVLIASEAVIRIS